MGKSKFCLTIWRSFDAVILSKKANQSNDLINIGNLGVFRSKQKVQYSAVKRIHLQYLSFILQKLSMSISVSGFTLFLQTKLTKLQSK